MRYSIHYGAQKQFFSLPDGVTVREASTAPVPVLDTEVELIQHALDNPIASVPLEELAKAGQRVVIISDDNTRPTPVSLLLPPVLHRLERAGVKKEDITILIASGTHRPMTEEELEEKLGCAVIRDFAILQHDYRDEDNLVHVGVSSGGTPIRVNRVAKEADLVIGIGNIVPHRFCGFSGGAKIIVPGISSEETTAGTHLMVTRYPDIQMGRTENSAREEIERIGAVFSSFFLVNTVLDSSHRLLGLFCGDMQKAFRAGAAFAQQSTAVSIKNEADIVIASPFPNDYNLWQAGKALYTADLAVKEGGLIILVSPLTEGIGEHQEFEELLNRPYDQIAEKISRGEVEDIIGASAALAVSLVRKRASLWVVSDGLSQQQTENMDLLRFSTLQSAVDTACTHFGKESQVLLLHDATEIFLTRSS